MSREQRHSLSVSREELPDDEPLTRQEFARRLNRLLMEKGWSQSDLARRAFGTTVNSQGYTVAAKRDRVSCYITGKSFPDRKTLAKIAEAFGVEPEELLPNVTMNAIQKEEVSLEIRQAAGHPDKVWLRVNKLVSPAKAARVFTVLNDPEPA